MFNLLAEWILDPEDKFTFSVEMTIVAGFVIVWILVVILRAQYPQLTKHGWIELFIGAPCLILKGIFDGLDSIAPEGYVYNIHNIFDSLEATFMLIGLVLLGVGLLRIALYSSKVWEVR
ncbi:MAG: hypothetical protein FK731_08685 [Asgard group archaeon]|nr:hypothetical protein [Asgard group archaeon]